MVLALVGSAAPAAASSIEVSYVGQNPWFDSPGGTGSVEGQDGETATIVKDFTAVADIPIIIDAGPSPLGGVESIRINERVRNNTGVDWTDFHFVVQGIDANPGLLVEFLNVANPTGEWATIDAATPGVLSLYGSVPDGGIFSIGFDLQITTPEGAYSLFAIHEFPTVPEPAMLGLAGGVLLVVRLSLRCR
jgi:hypothetical protein